MCILYTWQIIEQSKQSEYHIAYYAVRMLGNSGNYMPPILVSSTAKSIATRILVIAKLNRKKEFTLKGFICDIKCPNNELPVQR